jgi:hypothetical protein
LTCFFYGKKKKKNARPWRLNNHVLDLGLDKQQETAIQQLEQDCLTLRRC